MIYKIPLYFEVEVEGDFEPSKLSAAVDKEVTLHLQKIINEHGGFPHSSHDWFGSLGPSLTKAASVKKIVINFVPRSRVIEKMKTHD